MKTIFSNKTQLKIFLILIPIILFLPFAGSGGGHRYTYFDKSFGLGFPYVVWSIGKINSLNATSAAILYNILFAYIFSVIASFTIKIFKEWCKSLFFMKFLCIIFAFSIIYLALSTSFVMLEHFIKQRAPFMPQPPFQHLPILARNTYAQVIAFKQDLAHLRNRDQNLTRAYDKISLQQAWDLVNEGNKPLQPVIIGILDTGLDKTHPEFENVKIGSSRGINSKDPDGHGTAVAGIIGANNILGAGGTLPADSPQMNGIVSGILGIDYTIEMRAFLNTEEIPRIIGGIPEEPPVPIPRALVALPPATLVTFGAFIENLDLAGAQIINISFGTPKCSAMPVTVRAAYYLADRSCASDAAFNELTQMYREIINAYPHILFVAGAGNESMDAIFSTPSNIDSDNVITVAASDLNDGLADFDIGSSNFGAVVDVAAPGKNIYAPTIGNSYTDDFDGTSAAASMVTGLAAMIKAISSDLTPQQLSSVVKTAFLSQ